jgi:hypothetical protein
VVGLQPLASVVYFSRSSLCTGLRIQLPGNRECLLLMAEVETGDIL